MKLTVAREVVKHVRTYAHLVRREAIKRAADAETQGWMLEWTRHEAQVLGQTGDVLTAHP